MNQDEYLNEVAGGIVDEMAEFEDREIRGFRKTIADDVRDMLIESNPSLSLNNSPELVMILITSIHSKDPCSSCVENLSNVSEWAEKNEHFSNNLRILLVDSINGFDDRKIWDKLKVSFDDVPVTLFFNSSLALIDVVQGVMSVNYLELFWTQHFE
jgi:hypothetical protein